MNNLTYGVFMDAHIFYADTLSWTAKALLARLKTMWSARRMESGEIIVVHPSNFWIAQEMHVSEKQAQRLIEQIVAGGFLTVEYAKALDARGRYYTDRILHDVLAEQWNELHNIDGTLKTPASECKTPASDTRTPASECWTKMSETGTKTASIGTGNRIRILGVETGVELERGVSSETHSPAVENADTLFGDELPTLKATEPINNNNAGGKKQSKRKTEGVNKVSARFIPPTLEEAQAVAAERGYTWEVAAFIDYYESIGWKVGKNKMQNWRRAMSTWDRHQKEYGGGNTAGGARRATHQPASDTVKGEAWKEYVRTE